MSELLPEYEKKTKKKPQQQITRNRNQYNAKCDNQLLLLWSVSPAGTLESQQIHGHIE